MNDELFSEGEFSHIYSYGMDSESIKKYINQLSKRITDYNRAYYIEAQPLVSDAQYDMLFDELLQLEKKYPQFQMASSPTQRVGSDLTQNIQSYAHLVPVLSLQKAYTMDEIQGWLQTCSQSIGEEYAIVIEQKIDGSSVMLYYENGYLIRALTRGDGHRGNDITENIRTIQSIPLYIDTHEKIAVRGEVFIGHTDFQKVREYNVMEYVNPRNYASGVLTRVKSSEVARVPLRFFAYELFFDTGVVTHHEGLHRLIEYGFVVNSTYFYCELMHFTVMHTYIEEWIVQQQAMREVLDYDIDGLVIKIDAIRERDILGCTAHHPRWAIAYKFEHEQAQSTVFAIRVQVGRTGRLTPLAEINPVYIAGATIRFVTLHNQDYIRKLQIAVGDVVSVSRRGDVIPAIESVLEYAPVSVRPWHIPLVCPSCYCLIIHEDAHAYCRNIECLAQLVRKIQYFVGRGQMNIDALGDKTIELFIHEGFLTRISDVYHLPYDKIINLDNFGDKKVARLQESIENSRQQPYVRVFASLGIAGIGEQTIRALIDGGYSDIEQLYELFDMGNEHEIITRAHGWSIKKVIALGRVLCSHYFRAEVIRLRNAGLNFSSNRNQIKDQSSLPEQYPQIFSGQVWCITGSFEYFRPRSQAVYYLQSCGAQIRNSISNKTTHLLAGRGSFKKSQVAQQKGIVVIDEERFIDILHEYSIILV